MNPMMKEVYHSFGAIERKAQGDDPPLPEDWNQKENDQRQKTSMVENGCDREDRQEKEDQTVV